MGNPVGRIFLALKATRQLGLPQVAAYARYQIGLRTGLYRLRTPANMVAQVGGLARSPFHPPAPESIRAAWAEGSDGTLPNSLAELLAEADEITAGQMRLFSRAHAPLEFGDINADLHWSAFEGKPAAWGIEDLKYAWEPARFGWAYPLGRAYLLTGKEDYPAAFWRHFESFTQANPPNQGLNWLSAQEVALRLLAMLFALGAFKQSPQTSAERAAALAQAIELHARRIPPTLAYARAQNNNHLVSEALGLYAAGWALPGHPAAGRWRQTGQRWLNQALQDQIAPDGTYAQHSLNYHRLMLQAALQARMLGCPLQPETEDRLAAAAGWLLAQVDPISGHAPNLGANDGAHILPLAPGGFSDYRPTAQASARAFLGQPAFPPGPWDEMSLWLGQELDRRQPVTSFPTSPAVLRAGSPENWASLRCARFTSRPSHADLLHMELWWQGENLALDAGTYRYTAPPPWDNALAGTLVHNTVMLNGQDQMSRAGRFLWLDWAQGKALQSGGDRISAQHDGYARLGALHRRTVDHPGPGQWTVTDQLLPAYSKSTAEGIHSFHLHWLLPDWPWHLQGSSLVLARPRGGSVRLALRSESGEGTLCLVRAGERLAGSGQPAPILGWHSPTYGQKLPALSFYLHGQARLPFTLVSDWLLEG